MIFLGVLLALLGYVLLFPLLTKIGVILLVIGLVLWVLGRSGRPIGGRSHWY